MLEEIIKRRSIRKFIDKEISKEQVNFILESARVAPSAHNRQPWHFVVLTKKQKDEVADKMIEVVTKNQIEDASVIHTAQIIKEANKLILVFYTNPSNGDTRDMDQQSIGAAMENMCLQATKMQIGSLWIGNTYVIKKELEQRYFSSGQLVSSLALGYPNQEPKPRPRKDLSEIITWMEEKL